ncbi:ribosome biogenesis protein tsr1 [Dorcoceras hygrometricum]|uniref:Ribosome biogenesis protein tsr1 n=1 Tax=Dorcoceras hygrometricum TaxID=472368 RepID=A0A2Z7CYF2_9LAMI|nr:ribosome biogenesis protein tsr1 [Dorcoceras hygrometricum]
MRRVDSYHALMIFGNSGLSDLVYTLDSQASQLVVEMTQLVVPREVDRVSQYHTASWFLCSEKAACADLLAFSCGAARPDLPDPVFSSPSWSLSVQAGLSLTSWALFCSSRATVLLACSLGPFRHLFQPLASTQSINWLIESVLRGYFKPYPRRATVQHQ